MKGGTTGPYVNSTRHSGQWRGGPANIKGANRSLRCGLLSSLCSPPAPRRTHPQSHCLFLFTYLFIYLVRKRVKKRKSRVEKEWKLSNQLSRGMHRGYRVGFFFL